jgi:hypothetical protein
MSAPTGAIEVSFPSESYLFDKNTESQLINQNPIASIQHSGEEYYQDLSFCASGMSGLITSVLLPTVDRDTPEGKV